ncbi:MAG: hypothetical protein QXX51_00705 [Candidatus Bathyarchaeia archaeon]
MVSSVLVEILCPQHGLERFKIKVIRKFNMASNDIVPKTRSRPKPKEISALYIGRNVSYNEVKEYLVNYFEQRGVIKDIIMMRMLT